MRRPTLASAALLGVITVALATMVGASGCGDKLSPPPTEDDAGTDAAIEASSNADARPDAEPGALFALSCKGTSGCTCPANGNCVITCPTSSANCSIKCEEGSTCTIDNQGTSPCQLTCGAGASCTVRDGTCTCVGGDCK